MKKIIYLIAVVTIVFVGFTGYKSYQKSTQKGITLDNKGATSGKGEAINSVDSGDLTPEEIENNKKQDEEYLKNGDGDQGEEGIEK